MGGARPIVAIVTLLSLAAPAHAADAEPGAISIQNSGVPTTIQGVVTDTGDVVVFEPGGPGWFAHVFDPVDGTRIATGLNVFGIDRVPAVAHWLALGVIEEGQNVDLNGDGDLGDSVVHLVDTVAGTVVNTGWSNRGIDAAAGRFILSVSGSRTWMTLSSTSPSPVRSTDP